MRIKRMAKGCVGVVMVLVVMVLSGCEGIDDLDMKGYAISGVPEPISNSDVATKNYVDISVYGYANTTYVDDAVAGLASEAYVENAVAGLASEAYVDEAVAGLASEAYVDSEVEGSKFNEGCRVYHSESQAIPDDTWTRVVFDSEAWDTDTMHDVVTNTDRLTCKTAGIYIVTFTCVYAPDADGQRRIYLTHSGGEHFAVLKFMPFTDYYTLNTITGIIELAVDEYVYVQTIQDSGGGLDILSAGDFTPEVAIHRIGDATGDGKKGGGASGKGREPVGVSDNETKGENEWWRIWK